MTSMLLDGAAINDENIASANIHEREFTYSEDDISAIFFILLTVLYVDHNKQHQGSLWQHWQDSGNCKYR